MSDSVIFEALKLALVESFFQQQHHYSPNNGTTYYGGQAAEMVKKILESDEFKKLQVELQQLIVSKKDEWEKLAISVATPLVEQKGRDVVNSWDFKDGLYALINKAALEHAKVMFENDPVLKEKVAAAVKSQKYTVEFDIRVKIVEERAPQ